MPLVFADAGTFTKRKKIPCLPGDIIGIELPLDTGTILKQMGREETMSHFEQFEPKDYIVFDARRCPRYSSFRCNVKVGHERFEPIELTPRVQSILYKMVTDRKKEVSGIIRNDEIRNVQEGSPVWAPIQADRTVNAIPFHTHPVSTYRQFDVNYGLPSITDLKYLHTGRLPSGVQNTHLLMSREGIYAIAKKTCDNVPKIWLDKTQFNKVLVDCSFILLPWNFNQSWFVF